MLKPLVRQFELLISNAGFYFFFSVVFCFLNSSAFGQEATLPPAVLEKAKVEANEKKSDSSDLDSLLLPFNYQSEGRRDPFKPYAPPLVKSGDTVRPLNPLEQFDVDELKLVGILWDVRNPRAMVEDPQRQVHIVEKNERIGRNNGFVAAIREGELVVVESVSSVEGPTYSSRIMKIKSKDVK